MKLQTMNLKKIILLLLPLIFLFNLAVSGQDNTKSLLKEAENLQTTGAISVSVGGDFFINGTFSAFVTERLDHFLTRLLFASVGGSGKSDSEEKTTTTQDELNSLLDQTIKRNIKILSIDGKVKLIDLEKFYLTGDISQNPYLKMDDLIIFKKINMETSYVIVDGAVNKKLKFPFVQGDKLSDALLFAHGVDEAYHNVKSAEIVRLSYDGNSMVTDTVSLKNADSVFLQPGDVIRVIGEEYYKKDYKVLVVGAVNKPGYYFITRDKTTLKDVLDKAKGFKANAWLEYAELVRATTPDKKVLKEMMASSYSNGQTDISMSEAFRPNLTWELWKMYRSANLYEDYYNIFRVDADIELVTRNKLVDFSKLRDPNAVENQFIVEDGDVIFVPEEVELVYVMGQVANPGQYTYSKGANYLDYIKKAGGFGESAEGEDEVYIIKGKSYNWIKVDDFVEIEPGDRIWVQKDPARSFNFYLGRVSAVTGIIGSIATIVLLVTQLVK